MVRLIFGLSLSFALSSLVEMHTGVLKDDFAAKESEFQESQIKELKSKVDKMTASQKNKNDTIDTITERPDKLNRQQDKDHKKMVVTEEILNTLDADIESEVQKTEDSVERVQEVTAKQLKVHFWDDTTHAAPREDILVGEGWTEYNGKKLGHKKDSSTPPWFVKTDDPAEADIIIWVTVMGRHEKEVPPIDSMKHLHKVIVLDHADGCTIHRSLQQMRARKTEIAYFKRSYVHRGDWNSFESNCTEAKNEVRPFAYSGAKAMMIPLDSPEADVNFIVKRPNEGKVYGKVDFSTREEKQPNSGYFTDQRYENFLVPFEDRKFTVTNILRYREDSPNKSRNRVVEWTHEFSKEMAGEPREMKVLNDGEKDIVSDKDGYSAFVGEVENFCIGYCFGPNYLRHLRDAKIIVTCNPSVWEGDFRLWEAFLSGAMVMVDKTVTIGWMPNPPKDGKHWITYDPANKKDFMKKLRHYTDPANKAETEKIAKKGYEFVLRNHMAVNRVDYVLNEVQPKLAKYIEDPAKRAILKLPPK